MKFFKYIFIPVAAALLATGCNKLLDKPSRYGIEGKEVTDNEKGLDLLLTGIYDDVSSSHYYGALLYLYDATKSPDFYQRNVGGGYSFYSENNYSLYSNMNGNPRNLWLRCYRVVRNATILIDSINEATGEIESLRKIKGQAYALRALAYFDLLRLFAYPPRYSCTWGSAYGDTFRLGVPIINDIATGFNIEDHVVTRSSADECWRMVREDMQKGYDLLEDTYAEPGHLGPAAALALLMRVNLYMEDYKEVVNLGVKWRQKYESDYTMLTYDNYTSNYYKSFNSERVWELKYSATDNLGASSISYWVRKQTYNIPGSPLDGTVSKNLGYAKLALTHQATTGGYECMTKYPNDVRQYLICTLGIPFSDEITIRKYIGDPTHYVHNIPVVRLPEIYFMLSEAYWKRGNQTAAQEMLAKVTSVRRKENNPTLVNLNDILDEKRREFILEGQTYFDWFRNGRNITIRPVVGCIQASEGISFGTTSGRSYRAVYPIPLNEMIANKAIRNQQNPGYSAYSERVEVEEDVY